MAEKQYETVDQVWEDIKGECLKYGAYRAKLESQKEKIKDIEALKEKRESAEEAITRWVRPR